MCIYTGESCYRFFTLTTFDYVTAPKRNNATDASIQHRNIKPAPGPTTGMRRSRNETTTDVNTMITRYAEVAIELRMPEYDVGGGTVAREPCRRVIVRLAITLHHEL